MSFFDEEFLEPIAREFRFRKSVKYIPNKNIFKLVDLGCGPKIRFLKYLVKKRFIVKNYVGIDPLINNTSVKSVDFGSVVRLIKAPLDKKIPLPSKSADVVVGFAFLEHIYNPEEILKESIRVLKNGGIAIFTTPTQRAKFLLEFLSFRLRLISEREIREHKRYFDKKNLIEILSTMKKEIRMHHEYFEFGFNNLIVIRKIK